MRAAIYARVSTEEQTYEQQVNACMRWCEQQNLEFDIFADKISGSTQSRPQFNDMLERIRRNEYGAIVIWKLDRLGRSTIHLLQLMEEFRNRNMQIVIVTGNIDTSRPEGRLFFTIIAGFAELEREYIKQRVQAGIDTKKEKGIPLGRPKGAKDKRPRRKSGYLMRYVNERRKGQTWYAKEKEKERNL